MALFSCARRLLGFLAAVTLLALVACSPAAPAATPTKAPAAQPPAASTTGSSATAAPKALTKVALGASEIFTQPYAIPVFVGISKGFFAAEGIQVELLTVSTAGDGFRGVDGGQITYFPTSPGGAANSILQGGKARIVGGVLAAGLGTGYLVKPDSPIKSYKDLKGKTLGIAAPGGYLHWVALAGIKAAGLTAQDVKMVNVASAPEAWAAVLGGSIDAAWTSAGGGAQMIMDGKARWAFTDFDVMPDWQGVVVYTSQKEMTERPEQLRAFLRAYQKSSEYTQANFDESVRIWAANPSVLQAGITYDRAKKIIEIAPVPKPALTTKLSLTGLKANGDLMLETGVVKEKVDWTKIIDQSFLAPALQVEISKIQ